MAAPIRRSDHPAQGLAEAGDRGRETPRSPVFHASGRRVEEALMDSGRLQWIVCRRETRVVEAARVECPLRGSVAGVTCLACRYLMASSDERGPAGWCEVAQDWPLPSHAPRPAAMPAARTVAIPVVGAGEMPKAPPPRSDRAAVRVPFVTPRRAPATVDSRA